MHHVHYTEQGLSDDPAVSERSVEPCIASVEAEAGENERRVERQSENIEKQAVEVLLSGIESSN